MKKLYMIFTLYLAVLSAAFVIIQFDATAVTVIFLSTFIASIVLALGNVSIILAIYFEPVYTRIKWPLFYLSVLTVGITAYAICVWAQVKFLEQLGIYTYIPLLVVFVLGSILYVYIKNILNREKDIFDVTWGDVFLGNEKINALETEEIKTASTRLYQVALGVVFAGIITETYVVVIIAALLGIVVAFKYFKKAALYLKTTAYIITEIIYFGSIVLAAILFYITGHPSVVFYPVIGFIIFKMVYYNALKQKSIHEKTRAY